jgi:integrase
MLKRGWPVFRIDTSGFALPVLLASAQGQDESSFLSKAKADHPAVSHGCHRNCLIPPSSMIAKRKSSEKDCLKERILTEDEEARLKNASYPILRSVISFALNTGMRHGEILNLRWNQVDLEALRLTVEKTKSGRPRTIPLNPPLLEELQRLKSQNGQGPCVFPNPDTGKPLRSMKTSFGAACRRAGITGLRFHDLRHTFGSRLVQKGVDIETVRSLLGHSSIAITQRYINSTDKRRKSAVDRLAETDPIRPQKGPNLLHGCDTAEKNDPSKVHVTSLTPCISAN